MRWIALAVMIGLPLPALALSCMPYNAISAFQDAAKSSDDYVVVLGNLSFDEKHLPQVDWNRQEDVKPDNYLTGRIAGKSLTRSGFTNAFQRQIDINVQCFGPWCGGLSTGRTLVFLKRKDRAYLLETNPCGGFAHGDPSNETLNKIEACMRGERCDADLPRR
ncbi:hypothetical protein K3556_13060 [Aliiroseovarius sp. M344]|uniref:hypothetical protein n=1 Tax=Aliiroseovarius sp. M344 TaxID=2867010 RepID=UPI0021ADB1F6|nr:hypothetical protein [Aliiroseovarius sp. M344]UWQ13847.1 hypothetical protein K3556_13060 [Aliiroseovarius sp. M344]